jgi:tetratricopeptide (TPR) repeat protein
MWELAAAWAWLVSLIGVVFLTWKRFPMVAIGLLWFLVASFPPSNFIPIWSGPIEDYYLFFPGVGLALVFLGCGKALLEWIKSSATDHKRLIGCCLLAVGGIWRILCIPMFWLQADLWNRPAELFVRMEISRPYQFQLQASTARELLVLGELQKAKELAQKSHETAPWYPNSGMILGYVALKEGDYATAEKHLRAALLKNNAQTPLHDFARLHLAETLQKQGAGSPLVRDTLLPLLNNQSGIYHLNAIRMLIECYLANNQPNDALRALKNAMILHPKDSQFSEILAKIEKTHPGISSTQ